MRKLAGVIAVAALVAAVPTQAVAQGAARPFNIGGQVSFGGDSDLGIGVRYENQLNSLMPSMPTLRAVGSFDFFFPGQGVDWLEFNIGAVYGFSGMSGGAITPYAGGGLNIARVSVDLGTLGSSSNTEVGLNLIGGARFRAMGSMTPYAEVRLELGGGEQFVITGGLLFF
ncbi:MAG TPA: hypothetical protein VNL98_10890 [Gemmatimonadales bacterium]|nr:hypothetical protein [Gemmatimonadales bacterium]